MNNKSAGRTILGITLVAAAAVVILNLAFDIDAIELTKGFGSWLYDLVWGNRMYRKG